MLLSLHNPSLSSVVPFFSYLIPSPMTYTKDDLEQIKNAILSLATGKRRVKVSMSNGSSIEYGQADLKALRKLQQEILSSVASSQAEKNFIRIQTRKGL